MDRIAELEAQLDAEREKVKGLHEATKVICGHCCEPMEIPSKAVLQTQLTQIQALVRAIKAEVWKEAAMKYALWVGDDSEVPADPHLDGYERFEEYCHARATLDATTPATPTHNGGA